MGGSSGFIFGAAITAGVGVAAYVGLGRLKTLPTPVARFFKAQARPPVVAAAALGAPQSGLTVLPSQYPAVRRDLSVVENLHGVTIMDPYRWLEDPDAKETEEFVEAQNKLTQSQLALCDTRPKFKALFTSIFDFEKYGSPWKAGDRYYYYYNSGLQSQYVLMTQPSLDAPGTVLLDPNTLSEDGTVALGSIAFSECGNYLAYTLNSGGSDWSTIHLMSIDQKSGKPTEMADKLELVKFSCLDWTHDSKGFFYNRYPDPKSGVKDLGTETDTNTNQLLCYHVIGTPQSDDAVVMAIPEHPTWMMGAQVTDDGDYILIGISEGCVPANRMYSVDMAKLDRNADGSIDFMAYDINKGSKMLPVVKLIDNFEASYSYVANDGNCFYFKTNLKAPKYKIVKADITKAGPPSSWPDVVPEHEKDVLKGALALKGDNLITRYLKDVQGCLQLRSLSTGAVRKEFKLPGVGSVPGIVGDRKETEFFYKFTSYTEPGATYRMDVATGQEEPQVFRRSVLKVAHNPGDYETTQVFIPSKDGTKIPAFITHKKGLKRDGNNPTLLYGYGGFNISLEPGFAASTLAFIKGYGGVHVVANLRGGGEYGVEWRNAGSKEKKQNVFDDFQAVAEYLIQEGYCSPKKLTIEGGSNGGLLVAACCNQRPDLYCCVLGHVGVMDMLRFHKFTIGHAWCTDYGNPDNAKDFEYILPYSPLHNVRTPQGGSRQYPAVLLATGDHDDRVVPLHSLKLIATLQHNLTNPAVVEDCQQKNPLLIRLEIRAGHGAGKPTKKVIEEKADMVAFAAKCMDAKWVDTTSSL